jgi:hypothetical protein
MKLQLLDELIAIGHGDLRSTDCLIAVDATNLPSPDPARAQKKFPKTATHPVVVRELASLDDFLQIPLPSHLHVEVARIRDENLIALKMSHVLGDAVSMFLFLKAMFGEEVADGEPELKSFPAKKDTPYRDLLNSELWPAKRKKGKERKFLFASLHHGEVNLPSWNDLLLYCLLEALPYKRKAVWVPVNVRKNFWKGFGNGLSRLRIYPPRGGNLADNLAHIRKQKREAMTSGEVALPPADFDIHHKRQRFLYDLWIRRPWADWGSVSLSHLTNSQGFLNKLHKVRGISNLMPAHNGAIFAVTNGPVTDFTLTYDPAAVTDEEAQILLRDFLAGLTAKL